MGREAKCRQLYGNLLCFSGSLSSYFYLNEASWNAKLKLDSGQPQAHGEADKEQAGDGGAGGGNAAVAAE